MTDEEKAEEILQTKGSMTFCAIGCGYTEKVKELIAIGLSEGRKELEKENTELKAQIEKMKCCKEDIINSIKSEKADIEWVKAHNGVAKFIYVQTIIDIINDKWELVK